MKTSGLDIDTLIHRYGLISDQVDAGELRVILDELVKTIERGTQGAVAEFGCYRGTTSLYIRRVLDALGDGREFHVYDSFEGLPAKGTEDSSPTGLQFKEGELNVSKKDFIREFAKAGLRLPRIHKGWFNNLASGDVPHKVAFAFLDGDYYESVKTPLRLLEGKLSPGAVVIVDDYANEALPGAAKALFEWANSHEYTIQTIRSLGIVRS